MKLGAFIALAICMCMQTSAHASPSSLPFVERAAAKSRAGQHAAAIELYRKAYEQDSQSSLLVAIAHEFQRAGNAREALAYFCSYIYVDAAGTLADEASTNARSIAATLGNPTQSDQEACSTRARASVPQATASSLSVDIMATESLPPKPPRITKREVVGLVGIAASVTSLGLALWEGRKITDLRNQISDHAAGVDLVELEGRKDSASMRQKLYLAAGGVTLITGGLLYVLGRADRKRQERAYVAPTLTKHGAGMAYGRRF
jgi:hypothetical protein